MKQLCSLLLAAALLLATPGCASQNTPSTTPSQTEPQPSNDIMLWEETIDFTANYIRTDGYHDDVKYPQVSVIRDRDALDAYYNANKDLYSLGRNPDPGSDYTKGFLDACDSYDAGYFAQKYLVALLLQEGSGSIRHSVESVSYRTNGTLGVSVLREVPEVGTADMAQWHILLEISRDYFVAADSVEVYLDGRLAWNGQPVDPPTPDSLHQVPPQGILITPEGESAMLLGQYHWSFTKNGEQTEATVADAPGGPLAVFGTSPVLIEAKYGESIYLPVPGTDTYAPTNSLGYLVKLHWDIPPSSISCICWKDAALLNSTVPSESLPIAPDGPFYALPGGHIYEFKVTWDDTGADCFGTATYYAYIHGSE